MYQKYGFFFSFSHISSSGWIPITRLCNVVFLANMLLLIFCLLFFERCKNGSLFTASVLCYSTAVLRGKWILYADVPCFWFNFVKTYWFCSSYKSLTFYIGQGSGKRQANSSWFSSTLVLLFHKEREKKIKFITIFLELWRNKRFCEKAQVVPGLSSIFDCVVFPISHLEKWFVVKEGRRKQKKIQDTWLINI